MEEALTLTRVEAACFDPIFERGQDLAKTGKVFNLALFFHEVRGLVQGSESEPYEVSISVNSGPTPGQRIDWASCTCKFAQSNAVDRSLCKHMAALALVAGVAYRVGREVAQIEAAAPASGATSRPSAPRI